MARFFIIFKKRKIEMRLTDSDNVKKAFADYDAVLDLYDGILLVQRCHGYRDNGSMVEITKCMEVGLEYCSDPEEPFCVDDVSVRKGSKFLVNIFYSDKSGMYMSPRFMHILNSLHNVCEAWFMADGTVRCGKEVHRNMLELDLKQYLMIYCGRLKEISHAKITDIKIIDYGK